jgi:hypothetical protein
MKRVHHVCWCLEPESMEGAKALWQDRLETELRDFPLPDLGIRVLLSWESGVEIICPLGEGDVGRRAREFLDAFGEGVYGVVFEVDDLSTAVAQAKTAGGDVVFREDTVLGEGPDALRILQAGFDELCGMRLVFQTATPVPEL